MISGRKLLIMCLLLAFLGLGSCSIGENPAKWFPNLRKEDKGPYGTWLAHKTLTNFFPEAKISDFSANYKFGSMSDDMNYGTHPNVIIIVGLSFELSENEWDGLRQFARHGNEVIIFCSRLDTKISADMNCAQQGRSEDEKPDRNDTNANTRVLTVKGSSRLYGFKGRAIDGYFRGLNSPIPNDEANEPGTDSTDSNSDPSYIMADTFGYANGNPDFIRFSMGSGHLTLHAAPLVLSNYFLLQPGNIEYLGHIWQTLPPNIDHIYWCNFQHRSAQESDFKSLLRHRSTFYALNLFLLLTIMYLLFQTKRRQRIIPIIPPLKNESVSFVETVGKLYYNKRNNANIAWKMVHQFLDWARVNYNLNTNAINNEFTRQLTVRSGLPEAITNEMTQMIIEVKLNSTTIDDPYLYRLYNTISQFYKNKHK